MKRSHDPETSPVNTGRPDNSPPVHWRVRLKIQVPLLAGRLKPGDEGRQTPRCGTRHKRMATNPKIIVVGGGLAGLSAVIKIAEAGGNVDLFSIVPVKRSHSVCAQDRKSTRLN